jgi:hypothetical protein
MTSKDLITIFTLIFALVLIILILVLIKRYKLKPETWPYLAGLGSGVYLFVPLMIQSIINRPLSELPNYTVTNLILSLAVSIAVYLMFHEIVVRSKRNKD